MIKKVISVCLSIILVISMLSTAVVFADTPANEEFLLHNYRTGTKIGEIKLSDGVMAAWGTGENGLVVPIERTNETRGTYNVYIQAIGLWAYNVSLHINDELIEAYPVFSVGGASVPGKSSADFAANAKKISNIKLKKGTNNIKLVAENPNVGLYKLVLEPVELGPGKEEGNEFPAYEYTTGNAATADGEKLSWGTGTAGLEIPITRTADTMGMYNISISSYGKWAYTVGAELDEESFGTWTTYTLGNDTAPESESSANLLSRAKKFENVYIGEGDHVLRLTADNNNVGFYKVILEPVEIGPALTEKNVFNGIDYKGNNGEATTADGLKMTWAKEMEIPIVRSSATKGQYDIKLEYYTQYSGTLTANINNRSQIWGTKTGSSAVAAITAANMQTHEMTGVWLNENINTLKLSCTQNTGYYKITLTPVKLGVNEADQTIRTYFADEYITTGVETGGTAKDKRIAWGANVTINVPISAAAKGRYLLTIETIAKWGPTLVVWVNGERILSSQVWGSGSDFGEFTDRTSKAILREGENTIYIPSTSNLGIKNIKLERLNEGVNGATLGVETAGDYLVKAVYTSSTDAAATINFAGNDITQGTWNKARAYDSVKYFNAGSIEVGKGYEVIYPELEGLNIKSVDFVPKAEIDGVLIDDVIMTKTNGTAEVIIEANADIIPVEGDIYKTSRYIFNNGSEAKNISVITAVYNGKVLDKVYVDNTAVDAGKDANVGRVVDISDGQTVKCFVWESLKPLAKDITRYGVDPDL